MAEKTSQKTNTTNKSQIERKRKTNLSEYGIQMREKKIKKDYGVSENNLSHMLNMHKKSTINTKIAPALGIYIGLESRLDNLCF